MTTNKGGFCRLFTSVLCACSLALSGCSLIGGSNEKASGEMPKTEFTIKSEQSDRKGQPTVETEIVVDSQSSKNEESSYWDSVIIPDAAEYYLSSADESTVRCYKEIYGGLYNYSEVIDLPDEVLHKDDVGDLISLVICTAPEINQISSEYSLVVDSSGYIEEIKVSYAKSKEQGDAELAQLKAEVASICAKAEGMDTYEKLKFFHDTIILKCSYSDEDKNAYSAYGCLIEGKAVCEGYSKAMLMLCQYADIECIPVMGSASLNDRPVAHIWNKVLIGGEWYNIDVTWDDPISNLGDDYLRYDYFNITDAACQADHIFEENAYMKYPSAASESYNYFVKSGLLIESSGSAAATVEKAIVEAAENGSRYVRVKCADRQLFDSVCSSLFDSGSGEIFAILSSADSKTSGLVSSDSYSVMKNENACTFTLIIN